MIFFLGLVFFTLSHLLFLDRTPGFHFDEAWAAAHSLRIAFESGFWPWRAMTVQTSSWSHYLTAILFKALTPSVFLYRASYFLMNLAALLMFCRGLRHFARPRVARALPWVAAFFPALVMNHRFAIEITAFHSLCFALIFYSLSCWQNPRKGYWPWVGLFLGCFLGLTSHVFFLGTLMALLWIVRIDHPEFFREQKHRKFLIALLVCLLPFVHGISREIVWKWKGMALLALVFALIAWLWLFHAELPRWAKKAEILFALVALPFGCNFLLFSEGHWLVLHHQGKIAFPYLVGMQFLALLALLAWYLKSHRSEDTRLLQLLRFGGLWLAASGLVMITQAPRYYEIAFWLLAILLAQVAVAVWEAKRWPRALLIFFFFAGALTYACNYLAPGDRQEGVDRDFRWGILRESSYDFIPKMAAVQFLNDHRCWDELRVSDERLDADFGVLRELEYDFTLRQRAEHIDCAWKQLCLRKTSSGVPAGEAVIFRDQNLVISECLEGAQ